MRRIEAALEPIIAACCRLAIGRLPINWSRAASCLKAGKDGLFGTSVLVSELHVNTYIEFWQSAAHFRSTTFKLVRPELNKKLPKTSAPLRH